MNVEIYRLKKKFSSFRSSVKIHLKHLHFEESLNKSMSLYFNLKNVTQIIKIFELKSCLKIKEKHRISAIMKNELL